MAKTKTITDIVTFLIFSLLLSLFISYISACLILHKTYPHDKHIIISLKSLLTKSLYLLNNNSGGYWDNPGADVFITATVIFIVTLSILLTLFRGNKLQKNVIERFNSVIHGDAKYATYNELKHTPLMNATSGIVLCKLQNKNLINNEIKHTLVIGGTGDNKTTGIMITSLLSINKDAYLKEKSALSSAFIFDIKGSIYPQTAGWGHTNGVRIIILDPTNPNYAKFNIFNEIDINRTDFTDKIEKIVQIIMDPSGKNYAADDFWKSHGRALMSARIAFELIKNKDKPTNKTTLQKIAYMFRGFDLENDCSYSMSTAFEDMRNCNHPYIKSAAYMYESTEPRTFAGYLSTAQNSLNLYVGTTLGEVTSDSTFRLRDLFYRYDLDNQTLPPVWFYLSVPFAELGRLEPFNQLFMSFYLDQLTQEDDEQLIKKYPVRIFVDEIAKLGKFDQIGYDLGMLRSYGGVAIFLTQSLQDLNNIYGNGNTISTNCTYLVVLGVQKTDLATAKAISASIGDRTVHEVVPTVNVKKGKGIFGINEETVSYTPHVHKRPLISPEEIISMSSSECIISAKGMNIKGNKIRFFDDLELVRRSKIPAPALVHLNMRVNHKVR